MSLWQNLRSLETRNLDLALGQRENQLVAGHLPAAIFRHRLSAAENLYQRNLTGHYGCVNALEFSQGGQLLASGGDDKRVLLWNIDREVASQLGKPRSMNVKHASNIFCLGFDIQNSYILSGGNDDLVIQHDLVTGTLLRHFSHDGPVYGLSVDRTSGHLFSVATEHGEILVYDLRAGKSEPLAIAKFKTPFNAVEFHPLNGNFLATANAKRGAMLWDLRHHQQALCQYNYIPESPSCMSVRFNCNGTLLLTLHRRLPPILFSPGSPEPVATFYHDEYFNSCTMKSCTFAGPQDELVVSGSDNFNMFIWRMDGVDLEEKNQWVDTPPVILTGHRSIVNQVRYNRQRCLLASSGVEKIIKLWSPFAQQGWEGSLTQAEELPYCTRTLHRNSSDYVSQDFSARNTDEDQVMLAFFDTLVQRELESWSTVDNQSSSSSSSSETSTERSELSSGAEEPSDEEREDPDHHNHDQPTTNEQEQDNEQDNDTPNVSELSWQTHPNRIFYLIAKKRRALLQLAVRGTTGMPRSVDQLLQRLLGEQKQAATQARISDWLEETQRLFGDDELPTTSAEAAAREQHRQTGRSPRRTQELKAVDPLQSTLGPSERKRKKSHQRVSVLKHRRTNRRQLSGSHPDNDSVASNDTEYLDEEEQPSTGDNNNSNHYGQADEDTASTSSSSSSGGSSCSSNTTTSMTSMEAQLSQAPSTSSSFPFLAEPEANNNSQLTSNHNHPPKSVVNGLIPDMCNTESTASTTSSSM
ncbi:DDB1- and CUL4-associated factor 5 [Drosophila kikkawai]|uniref:DDB1- and CUL4-associated factor 5 n=1 Tax=Drosophila kikkawai TaxID=30033 RepID=A0A6P4ITH8_DROKI|nr:DDB1- and CUL4-associated factor 5 [Drosophila kikkawai]XP_017026704.1 DDB1- and CUL4-associated factor 5 [Drosophila kikkawai]